MDFDPTRPEFCANPYPIYDRLREEAPVFYDPKLGLWHVFKYSDVLAISLDDERFSSEGGQRDAPAATVDHKAKRAKPGYLSSTDPSRHTKLRNLIQVAFTPRRIAAYEPRVRELARDLLDSLDGTSEFDLMERFAVPIPVFIISAMLGIPSPDWEQFRLWSDDIVNGLGSKAERRAEYPAQGTFDEMSRYFREIMATRRRSPSEDLVSALVEAEIDGERLQDQDIVYFCILLLVAGNETTAALIGNSVITLTDHPDVLARLQKDFSRLPAAIEEVLRYESPTRGSVRRATEPIELRGQKIAAGDWLYIWRQAANRDPEAFDRPDIFDIDRSPNRHLSFGQGIHFCIGAPLARLESRVAIEALLTRYRSISRHQPFTRIETWVHNTPHSLPLVVER